MARNRWRTVQPLTLLWSVRALHVSPDPNEYSTRREHSTAKWEVNEKNWTNIECFTHFGCDIKWKLFAYYKPSNDHCFGSPISAPKFGRLFWIVWLLITRSFCGVGRQLKNFCPFHMRSHRFSSKGRQTLQLSCIGNAFVDALMRRCVRRFLTRDENVIRTAIVWINAFLGFQLTIKPIDVLDQFGD